MNETGRLWDMEMTQSCREDIEAILALYDEATALQATKGMTQWPKIDRSRIEMEVDEGRQWKMTEQGQIVCVWVVAFEDPQIWGEKKDEPSLYIHRIANHPLHRGRGLVGQLVSWAKSYCSDENLHFIRLDTVGFNEALIRVYTSHGFTVLEPIVLDDPSGLPSHYRGGEVYLFEIKLNP
ncbi:GNAT family N-acetyltransferase [Candidatus Poseidoniaceae archaeon]|nr:GNAT family N-acetyltransferase [Candidatus Poseidoniaceae archaeon]MDA9166299.1 GNAT family N-acetyltransferase [Candidatus Poseidoniaceae archaeon]MDB2560595.1 GNAT family N-acetyltransferase [Euryarchaeota archaeon]